MICFPFAWLWSMEPCCYSVPKLCPTLFNLQHARFSCPSPTSRACLNSCPSSQWCHPAISASVVSFSSCLQYFPASRSFPVSQLFTSGGQSIEASPSALVLPMNIQDCFPLGLTGLISLLSKGLSRAFSSITVGKHQFFSAQLLYGPALTSVHNCWKNHSFDCMETRYWESIALDLLRE